jgi:peroxiredoxin Q/BCP
MKRTILLSGFFLIISGLAFSQVKKGEKVPDFSAIDQEGKEWQLSENLHSGDYLVIYFYPVAFTGGCTAQACSYRDQRSDLESAGARVVGVSGDSPGTLDLFAREHRLNFTLLSDESGKIADLFGVPRNDGGVIRKEVNGKTLDLVRGTTIQRWTFILDEEGRLIYKDSEVNAAGDSNRVVQFLESL